MVDRLALAFRHVRRARDIVGRQEMLIERLSAIGADTRTAKALLRRYEDNLAIFEAELEELQRKAGSA